MTSPTSLTSRVSELIREVAAAEIVPRFRRLSAGDIQAKGPGDLVTTADRMAELALAPRLLDLLPGSVVVGEEAVHGDPGLLRHLADGRPDQNVWLVDPVDGTERFARGDADFGTLVALCRGGRARVGWIWLPIAEVLLVAEEGSGVCIDGQAAVVQPPPAPPGLRGMVASRFVPDPIRRRVEEHGPALGRIGGWKCAAVDYIELVRGELDFLLYHQAHPWDHAPGALAVREAGGVARRYDGADFVDAEVGDGLLVAASAGLWDDLAARLLRG